MPRKYQPIFLGILLVTLGFVLYSTLRPGTVSVRVSGVEGPFTPVNVDNPALRLDILQRFLNLEYGGSRRNIFSAAPPAPPPAPANPAPDTALQPSLPSGPPPLRIDAKFFGYASDAYGNHRRAFFATTNNEDIFIAGEGDTLMGRFRVVKLTNTTADVEEVSSGRRVTLPLEEPGPNG